MRTRRVTRNFDRTCIGCGNPFTTSYARQVRCEKNCGRQLSGHKARALARLANDLTFVGVDGEGVDRPSGGHQYVMLSVGQRTLWNDGEALALGSILSFLWECYTEQPDAVYIGFFLGYDFTHWLKLLPEREARLLLTNDGIKKRTSQRKTRANPFPDAVVWEGWEIDIMAGRRFKLRPHICVMSQYTGFCRNRTCQKNLGDSLVIRHPGEPKIIYAGEMDWRIPTSDGLGSIWKGSTKAFWKAAMPRMHTVGQRGTKRGSGGTTVSGWLYVCDTGAFWQTSFVNVISPAKWKTPVCSEVEYETIITGKASRGITADYDDTDYYEDMVKYNILENEILARVTTRLNEGFMNDQIPIKIGRNEWYGPGRAAQLWMDQLNARIADDSAIQYNKTVTRHNADILNARMERKNEGGIASADVYLSMPSWAYDAARDSYYGGWFEQCMHGHIGDVWEYDINSAYPFIIASLPCLHDMGIHNGQWSKGDVDRIPESTSRRYTLVRCRVDGSNPYIGAMPHRTKRGSILRPHVTEGWYWQHEIDAAKRAGLIDTVTVHEWVSYLACECGNPFNPDDIGIERLYDMRLDVGKDSPQGIAAKLVYNSAYGKTAQSVGTPKYGNPFYASLITAGCRTLILEAIASHPYGAAAVSMVATDGLYFTSRHDGLDIDASRLGAWDEKFKSGMTQLMPGVYWDDKTRDGIKTGNAPALKSRGVNAKDLAANIEYLDGMFARSAMSLETGGEYEWPAMTFTVRFLMDTAKLALQRNKWHTAGRIQHGSTRTISSNPISKRETSSAYVDYMHGGLIRTTPYRQSDGIETTPYPRSFGYLERDIMGDPFPGQLDRDGDSGLSYWRDVMKNLS